MQPGTPTWWPPAKSGRSLPELRSAGRALPERTGGTGVYSSARCRSGLVCSPVPRRGGRRQRAGRSLPELRSAGRALPERTGGTGVYSSARCRSGLVCSPVPRRGGRRQRAGRSLPELRSAGGHFPNALAEQAHIAAQDVDPVWYAARYPDVVAAGKDPVDHYLNYGRLEGRLPNALVDESFRRTGIRSALNLEELDIGSLVQLLFESFLGRGAKPQEVMHYVNLVDCGQGSRYSILKTFIEYHLHINSNPQKTEDFKNDVSSAILFGRRHMLTNLEWEARRQVVDSGAGGNSFPRHSRFAIRSQQTPLISIITSMYNGDEYIKHFMKNITGQTIFHRCELIIIDAASPGTESSVISPYLKNFPNINYVRLPERVGIYDAWNTGIKLSSGLYLTNANLDDCRAHDSLELQASVLETLPFVDVTYQDVLYGFEKNIGFERLEHFGFKTNLPIVTRYNILEFNSPHNAPMWRRSIHEDVGFFNTDYRSAADMEFWMRCLIKNKCSTNQTPHM